MNISGEVFDYVKNRLNITWQDTATDAGIAGVIEEGMAYIDGKLGECADYASAASPRALLVEYCRYARAEALDVFENNYLALILAMQHDRMVRDYAETAEQDE